MSLEITAMFSYLSNTPKANIMYDVIYEFVADVCISRSFKIDNMIRAIQDIIEEQPPEYATTMIIDYLYDVEPDTFKCPKRVDILDFVICVQSE